MSNSAFKTPLLSAPKVNLFNAEKASDSDESVASSNSDHLGSTTSSSSKGQISLVAEFDDLMRGYHILKPTLLESELCFLDFVEQVKEHFVEHFQVVDECKRLQEMLEKRVHDCSDLEHKLVTARKLLDAEKLHTRMVQKERDELAGQLNVIRELLLEQNGNNRLSFDDMRQKLAFLHSNSEDTNGNGFYRQLSAIKEINSTGSILSDLSYSRSEDDLNSTESRSRAWKKHRASTDGVAEPAVKKRRSSGKKQPVEINATDTVRATTTVTVSKDGPIKATSVIESVPNVPKTPGRSESISTNATCVNAPPANLVFESWARESPRAGDGNIIRRQHSYQHKTLVMPESCTACNKRIRFGKTAAKCKECKAICHLECKENLPLPCIPQVNTPNQRGGNGVIGDFTPTTAPMVPALLIHCINEIELRGLSEVGLYRVPGAERDVKALKERFLKGRGAPCLNDIDIHVICGTVKDFLRGLQEPIVTYGLWKKFVTAVEADPVDVQPALCQVISELPQPNRDTMAYMMLHLQKVAEAKACKMDISNLSKVFGPTIVGYSSDDPNPSTLLDEMVRHNNVMEQLIRLPSDYWASFINVNCERSTSRLQQTPSTDSLLRPLGSRGHFTPLGTNSTRNKKRQRYFPSPKSFR